MNRMHHCHAMRCSVNVPPRYHMCGRHWAMVPRPLQKALWAAYRSGQERRMDPTADYLRAAAACVRAVAQAEGYPDDEIEPEIEAYEVWAVMTEEE